MPRAWNEQCEFYKWRAKYGGMDASMMSDMKAVVVANPKLLEIPCGTVEQMKLVNTFCWLDEYSNKIEPKIITTGGHHG